MRRHPLAMLCNSRRRPQGLAHFQHCVSLRFDVSASLEVIEILLCVRNLCFVADPGEGHQDNGSLGYIRRILFLSGKEFFKAVRSLVELIKNCQLEKLSQVFKRLCRR